MKETLTHEPVNKTFYPARELKPTDIIKEPESWEVQAWTPYLKGLNHE